ncbi:hypothetical protein F4553_004992 [Allocatelliglobosispora scoriae]|uniref:Uncharacterized protein n=1 Tax=Allocatelliglobosispora scoriae TaxID=643052 RepID=A0A841BXF8_9ACTN|nr:hypothetical protein [Allocatelliglobosispora scoriae]MBB5871613.1 hypothetical protein [Allocatelliglobosispora scoriae]
MRQWPESHDHLEDAVLSRRRLVSVVAISALALTGLSACRSTPGIAAYVGSEKYTDTYVDNLINDFDAKLVAQIRVQAKTQTDQAVKAGQIKPEDAAAQVDKAVADQQATTLKNFGDLRQTVIRMLVVRDAGNIYAKSHNITVPPADTATAAAQNNLPADADLVKLFAEYSTTLNALATTAKSTAPSEADQHEAYDNLQVQPGTVKPSFETLQGNFTQEAMGSAVGVRDLLVTALDEAKSSVSPRYTGAAQDLQIQLQQLQAQTKIQVMLAPIGAVSNAPAVASTEAPAA